MASQTEILNNALNALGLKRLLSIDDDGETAIVMRTIWALKKDAELQAHAWSFAIKRVQLPRLVSAPAFGYSNEYQLPSDYLSMVEVGEDFVFYTPTSQINIFSVEGGKILTNEGAPLRIRYVRRVDNAGDFPPLFAEALSYKLAMSAYSRLGAPTASREEIMQQYKMTLAEARRSNNIEKPPQQTPDESWWAARL